MTTKRTKPAAERTISRRRFLQATGSTVLAAGSGPVLLTPRRAHARQKTLKILQWNHFVPAYDEWFKNTYVKEWGERNDTRVIVDTVGITSLNSRATAEVAAGKGHDLFMFLTPPPLFEEHVIDHRDIYVECERRYGKPIDLAVRSTYNTRTDKYYGFSDSYVPDPINYRKDLWDDVGVYPDTWDDVRVGGRRIMRKHHVPVGIGLAPELDSNMALRSIMLSFGASVQDEHGRPMLKSPQTLEALKFVKALYEESMTDAVFTWDPSSNNRFLLAGRGSLTLNAISITRTGENKKIPVANNIMLAKAAAGPARRVSLQHLLDIYVIWKFAENIDGAKQFLVDYVGNFRTAFLASQFYNFPCFPQTVPDLGQLVARDPKAVPEDKYNIFSDVSDWVTSVGYPGHANAAIDEIFGNWTIPTMFANAAKGTMKPAEALNAAHREVTAVFDKWRARGLV
ncbi:MAG: extracellular solute-binding protein, partial [Gammaproteobacteria bacterium]|nr:extracellular solute-binding protein [Gammaproteobacteria bacterium]